MLILKQKSCCYPRDLATTADTLARFRLVAVKNRRADNGKVTGYPRSDLSKEQYKPLLNKTLRYPAPK